MENVTVAEAKEKLEDLISRAAHGEDVRITDARLGTVRLLPAAAQAEAEQLPERRPGRWKGRFTMPALVRATYRRRAEVVIG